MNRFKNHLETLHDIHGFLQFISSKLSENSSCKFSLLTLIEEFEAVLDDFENISDEIFEFVITSLVNKLNEISEVINSIRNESKCELSDKELKYFQSIVAIEMYNLNK